MNTLPTLMYIYTMCPQKTKECVDPSGTKVTGELYYVYTGN